MKTKHLTLATLNTLGVIAWTALWATWDSPWRYICIPLMFVCTWVASYHWTMLAAKQNTPTRGTQQLS
jgi:hypothetical protein